MSAIFQIKEEAAKRKALRDAKLRMNEAIKNASKTKSPEEIAAEVMREAERRKEEELAALRQKEEDEKAARAGLKIAFYACIIKIILFLLKNLNFVNYY